MSRKASAREYSFPKADYEQESSEGRIKVDEGSYRCKVQHLPNSLDPHKSISGYHYH